MASRPQISSVRAASGIRARRAPRSVTESHSGGSPSPAREPPCARSARASTRRRAAKRGSRGLEHPVEAGDREDLRHHRVSADHANRATAAAQAFLRDHREPPAEPIPAQGDGGGRDLWPFQARYLSLRDSPRPSVRRRNPAARRGRRDDGSLRATRRAAPEGPALPVQRPTAYTAYGSLPVIVIAGELKPSNVSA